MFEILEQRLKPYNNVELIHANILDLDDSLFKDKKVISNPPYKISSPLLFKLFNTKYKMAILTLQKEFAERLIAKPSSKEYGKLTLNSYIYSNVELLKDVPNTFFYPTPKVDSALLKILPRDYWKQITDLEFYKKVVNSLFIHKNKILEKVIKKILKKQIGIEEIMDIISNIPHNGKRIRELTPENIIELSNWLYKKNIWT